MRASNKQSSIASGQLEKADSLVLANRFKEALVELEPIRLNGSLAAFSEEEARCHYLRGFVLWKLGEKKQALKPSRQALEIYLSRHDFAGIAKSENLLGSVLLDLGELKAAEEYLEMAVSGFKRANDWASAARALNKISYLHSIKGELSLAIYFDEQAVESARRGGDSYYEKVLKGHLAVYYLLLGNWKKAVNNLQEFIAEAQKASDWPSLAIGRLSSGYADNMRGLFKRARQNFLEAIRICNQEKLIGSLKIAYEYFGELCIAEKRFEEAEAYLGKALEIGERVSPYGTIMTQRWRLMGDLYNAKGEPHKALEAYKTCESYLIKLPEELERGACLVGKGAAFSRLEEWNVARDNFDKALQVFAKCENDWEMAKAVVVAVESGAYSPRQVKGQLFVAKELFQKLEHPAWEVRVDRLLSCPEAASLLHLPLRSEKAHLERERVLAALEQAGGNRTRAAEALGIPRTTLISILRRSGVKY